MFASTVSPIRNFGVWTIWRNCYTIYFGSDSHVVRNWVSSEGCTQDCKKVKPPMVSWSIQGSQAWAVGRLWILLPKCLLAIRAHQEQVLHPLLHFDFACNGSCTIRNFWLFGQASERSYQARAGRGVYLRSVYHQRVDAGILPKLAYSKRGGIGTLLYWNGWIRAMTNQQIPTDTTKSDTGMGNFLPTDPLRGWPIKGWIVGPNWFIFKPTKHFLLLLLSWKLHSV